MLSRVADCLFWMSRYLERAEHVARMVRVASNLELDLAGLITGDYEPPWRANLVILQQAVPERAYGAPDPSSVVAAWLAFDLDNPTSILSNVNRARNNARSIRGTIGPDVWRAINDLYWQLRDVDFEARARESPFDYCQAVEVGSQRFQGVCDATLPHDEGWQFIQLGKYLERADKTIRTLDVKSRQLQSLTSPAELPLANLECAGVLKSCLAFEAYQRAYISRVEPDRVVEFLLLHATFPRSVRFCLESAATALEAVEECTGRRGGGRMDRLLGRLLGELRYAEPAELLSGDFHGFLTTLLQKCGEVGRAIQEQYALLN